MKKSVFILLPAMLSMMACSQRHTYTVSHGDSSVVAGYGNNSGKQTVVEKPIPRTKLVNSESMIPKATAFKMNGNYADNVAVTLDAAGNLVYFPAPGDITANSAPLDLGEGWWLNRQGLGQNSVFTTYTFADYAALPQAPSPEQIKAAIIPGSEVVEMVVLPFTVSEAPAKIDEIKVFLGE